MRKVILAMQMTLDGFVSGPNGAFDWLMGGDDVWEEMFKDLNSVDTIIVGRKMYPEYAGHWRSVLADPSNNGPEKKYAQFADRTPHIVLSTTMSKTDWNNTSIAADAAKAINELKEKNGKDIVVWGGATTASGLINRGLIDELRITLNPNILGGGLGLFKNVTGRHKLSLIDSRPLKSGIVILRYKLTN